MSDRAVIQADLEGDLKIKQKAKGIQEALKGAKAEGEGAKAGVKSAGGAVEGLGQQVDALRSRITPQALLGGFIGGALMTSVGAVVSYLKEGADKAREFGDRTAGGARRAGVDMNAFRGILGTTERETLQSVDAQQDFVDELQRLTGGGAGAVQSLRGIGAITTSLGMGLRDVVGTVASLQDGLQRTGDVSGDLSRLVEQSRRLGTIGGPAKFLETIGALRGVFASVNTEMDESATKMKALTAIAAKNYNPAQATGVVAGAVGLLESQADNIQRVAGVKLRDKNGNLKDDAVLPGLKLLRDRALKDNGGNRELAEMGLRKRTDARTAAFIMNHLPEVEEETMRSYGSSVVQLDPKTGKIASSEVLAPRREEAETRDIKRSREGRRAHLEVLSDQRQRAGGDVVAQAQEWLTETAMTSSMREASFDRKDANGQPMQLRMHPDDLAKQAVIIANTLRENPPVVRVPRPAMKPAAETP